MCLLMEKNIPLITNTQNVQHINPVINSALTRNIVILNRQSKSAQILQNPKCEEFLFNLKIISDNI